MRSKRLFDRSPVTFIFATILMFPLFAAAQFTPSPANRIQFEINRGQFDSRVRFAARTAAGMVYLTATDAVFVVADPTADRHRATAVYMTLAGADANAPFGGVGELPGRLNYLRGNDPAQWQTDVPTFAGARQNAVYPGVDVDWHASAGGTLQYDFIVAPNADESRIEWRVAGAESLAVDADGSLVIKTATGVIRQAKPFSYQEENGFRAEVESRFEVRGGNRVGFVVGAHDATRALVIDPSVTLGALPASTLLGGSSNDVGLDGKTDSAGNIYVTGYAFSALFPTTPGTFDTSQNANEDVFVTKLNPSETQLIFSTFIGGNGADEARALVLDASNNIYLAGETTSATFPTTAGAFDTTFNGSADAFVLKLNPTGTTLGFSSFVGGGAFDEAFGLARDGSGNLYIAGRTNGGTFPTTVGAFDGSFNGISDAFVAKLDSTASTLVYSTFLGGDATDFAEAVVVDSGGNAFVTGFTANGTTVDYPTTAGAFQTTYQGGTNDIFVTKLNAAGSALSYSTFVGGTDSDSANDIAIDSVGNAYVVGSVLNGGGFPVTVGAYDTTHNGALDTVVFELNPTGAGLIFSTYIGGSGSDIGNAIAVDPTGSVYVAGYTINAATDYPVTTGAYQSVHNGGHDVYFSRLSPNGSTLLYSTLFGTTGDDDCNAIWLDSKGNVYLTGLSNTSATTIPTSLDAYQNFYGGGQDVFVSKFGDPAISGRVMDQTGLPIANTAVSLSGLRSDFMMSDAQGYFGFTDTFFNGSFNVAAVNALYNFTPNSVAIPQLLSNMELNFVGRPTSSGPTLASVRVGGSVQSALGDAPLSGTTLTLIDTVHPNNVRTISSDALGKYDFNNVLAGGFYLVVPQRDGYNFSPAIHEIALFSDTLNLDFTATPNAPRPVGDFDADGRSDIAVFRPSEGNWYVLGSRTGGAKVVHFGIAGDIPVAEDYDGDRITDYAVYRPSEGNWYFQLSSNGFAATHFGTPEDIPVAADYDGDGRADIAVYRPSTGVWHRLTSSDGAYSAIRFGIATDRPVTGDFDGDGKADLSVFRDGLWYRQSSHDGAVSVVNFGLAGDKPLSGDFDGDGRADIAVWRPSNGVFYWLGSLGDQFGARQFGASGDLPVISDYDGDGRFDQAVYRAGTWYVARAGGGYASVPFGLASDIPTPSADIP